LLSGLTASLTTDQSVYQAGQPIKFKFTETNTSSQPIKLVYGPSNDGFIVTGPGGSVWRSNAGVVPMFLVLDTLQPGESYTTSATWNGVPNEQQPPLLAPGTFTVTNELAPNGPSATFQIQSQLSYNLTTDRSEYQIGQPVVITLTETNVTSQPITLNVAPTDFVVSSSGASVWKSPTSGQVTPQAIRPGQSIIQTATWDGIANTGSLLGTNVWGFLSVSSPNAPEGLTASFDIANPVTRTLSVNSPATERGQPVVMTFNETNTSDQTITVLDSPGTFSVTSDLTGSPVFSETEPGPPTTVTLEPGQSLTKTATWNTDAGSTTPGIYDVGYMDATQGARADVQILPSGLSVPPINPIDSPVAATVSTSHTAYKLGSRVAISLTLTNTSGETVPLGTNSGFASFKILRASVVVGRGRQKVTIARGRQAARAQQVLAAGASKTIKLAWVAKSNAHGAKGLAPGVYTIEAWDGDYMATATIQLGR
jgi:hypothetical protein